jgi:hypothetical protein
MTQIVRQGLGLSPLPDPACVADWDSTSYDPTPPHCLRRVDSNLHYPENLVGEVHADGRIWSRTLWDIRNTPGPTQANTIILQGQFDFPGTNMPDLARRTVATANQLYGSAVAAAVQAQFAARGIL